MFYHFDITNDSQLDNDELNSIEHLKNELCTERFFQQCDQDNDHRLFSYEWCHCFQYARKLISYLFSKYFLYFIIVLPCELHNYHLDKAFSNKSMEGIFRPRCNTKGYYAARQCNTDTSRQCWCVDKHGIEVEGTRQDDDHMPQCGSVKKKFIEFSIYFIFR